MWLFRLVLIVAVLVAVWYVVRAIRSGGLPGSSRELTFTPVEQLPDEARRVIDAALARGERGTALEHYRAATGSGPAQARTAVETYAWKQGGASPQ